VSVEREGVAAIEDPFVRTFVRASVHFRRFFPYYLAGTAWVLMMLLIAPRGASQTQQTAVPDPFTGNAQEASSGQTVESAITDETAGAAPFSDVGVATSDATSFSGLSATPADSTDFSGSNSEGFSSDSSFDAAAFEASAGSDLVIEPEARPIRIVQSGYSSRTGGTPLEQEPPSDGLPVSALPNGEAAKRSFVKLEGDETILKLKLVDDPSNVGAEQAVVRACVISVDGWKAERGMAMDAEPTWGEPCVDGARGEDGVWTFDLTVFGSPESNAGFALTPGGPAPFNLTFSPSPVRSS
jgi:hypothetical protein